MADSSLAVNTRVALATLRNAAAKFLYQAGGESPSLRLTAWKDWVDEMLLSLQQGGLDPAAVLSPATLGVSGSAEAVDEVDFAVSVGWDAADDDVVQDSTAGSTIALFHFTVLAGPEPVAAPQTITLTWPTALAAAPKGAFVQLTGGSDTAVTGFKVTTLSTTQCVLTTIGNPTLDETVSASVLVVF